MFYKLIDSEILIISVIYEFEVFYEQKIYATVRRRHIRSYKPAILAMYVCMSIYNSETIRVRSTKLWDNTFCECTQLKFILNVTSLFCASVNR